MKHLKLIISLFLAIVLFSGFWDGKTKKELFKEKIEGRVERIKTGNETLQLLFNYDPKSQEILNRAYGYATFTNFGVNLIVLSAEGGKGMAHNNRTGINTYMNMGSGGLGIGLGVKDFRIVFLFENRAVYESFINAGWEANAQADLAAKYGETGGEINGAITVAPGVKLYKLTQNGLAAQATIQGTKYWVDSDLN